MAIQRFFFRKNNFDDMGSRRNVTDFKFATWNTNGARWNVIAEFMEHGENGALDVLGIQEAGSLRAIRDYISTTENLPQIPVCLGGFELNDDSDIGLTEYRWNNYYIYYDDRRVIDPQNSEAFATDALDKQNMAIISRERATSIVIIPSEVPNLDDSYERDSMVVDSLSGPNRNTREDRVYINRPAIGIQLGNSFFFNIHPEPRRRANEAPMLVNVIQNYMRTYERNSTWVIMGDFNREPNELIPFLPPAADMHIVQPNSRTRSSGLLDYAIFGGRQYYANLIAVIVEQFFRRHAPGGRNPSDHSPVQFN